MKIKIRDYDLTGKKNLLMVREPDGVKDVDLLVV